MGGRLVLAVAATKKTSGFEADLGQAQTVDTIAVDGLPAPFLKRLRLEGSGDRARWTMLVAEGTLFDLPQEALLQLYLQFRPGAYRYLRVTWNDTNSGRLPLPRGRQSARRSATMRSRHEPVTAAVTVQRRASEPEVSRYRAAAARGRLADRGADAGRRRRATFPTSDGERSASRQAPLAAPVELGAATAHARRA